MLRNRVIVPILLLVYYTGWTVFSQPLNVSLVLMSSWDSMAEYGRSKTAPVVAASVELLNKQYAGRLAFTIVSAVPPEVTSCDRLTSRVGFLATEYFYRKGGRNQTMAFIGPSCSGAVVSSASFLAVSVCPLYGPQLLHHKKAIQFLCHKKAIQFLCLFQGGRHRLFPSKYSHLAPIVVSCFGNKF